jgi:pantetheine-phosphate adenylyltransferase
MKTAIYAGSFDPITNGHINIVERALKIFDQVVIVIAKSPNKKSYLSYEERKKLLQEVFSKNSQVKVDSWDGLIVDYAKNHSISYLVRGLRPTGDFDWEFQMASMNRKLNDDLEVVFLITSDQHYYVSSSIVREIAEHGGDVAPFVPANVTSFIKEKIKNK